MRVSVIVPALNEAARIQSLLHDLQPLRGEGEVIVVDGGSTDDTVALARDLADRVLVHTPGGRARQMNAGAEQARGELLWFVHADCRAGAAVLAALTEAAGGNREWGRFDITIDAAHPLLSVVAAMMNLRSRLTGIATGDQGLFVRTAAFHAVGGFPDIPLMEDIAICRHLRARGRPSCPSARLRTSARRWQQHGVLRTILLMWCLRWAYWRGADPAVLASRYRGGGA